jgi:hypothetical protein
MNRENVLAQIAMDLRTNDYLCDVYNDLAQISKECGPYDEVPTMDLIIRSKAQSIAHSLGFHFKPEELQMYFSTDVAVRNYVYDEVEEEDDLPF